MALKLLKNGENGKTRYVLSVRGDIRFHIFKKGKATIPKIPLIMGTKHILLENFRSSKQRF